LGFEIADVQKGERRIYRGGGDGKGRDTRSFYYAVVGGRGSKKRRSLQNSHNHLGLRTGKGGTKIASGTKGATYFRARKTNRLLQKGGTKLMEKERGGGGVVG